MPKILVIGAGAWGTALAQLVRANGAETLLWAREPELLAAINNEHRNPLYLPGIALDPGIRAIGETKVPSGTDAVLLVAPVQHLRSVAGQFADTLRPGVPVAICAKGIEQISGSMPSEILAEILPDAPLAVLSGPTFAREVADGKPTAVTLATADAALGQRLIGWLGRPTFRPYYSPDPIGAEIGGAVKNVLAIACGIVTGRGLGDNARAALMTRGMAEIMRLGRAKGAQSSTLMGLSGFGDLVLTCAGGQSRNMSLGLALGQGQALQEILGARHSVAEGVATAAAVTGRAARLGIDMPICAAVNSSLHQGAAIDQVIQMLLSRPFTNEADRGE